MVAQTYGTPVLYAETVAPPAATLASDVRAEAADIVHSAPDRVGSALERDTLGWVVTIATRWATHKHVPAATNCANAVVFRRTPVAVRASTVPVATMRVSAIDAAVRDAGSDALEYSPTSAV